MKKILIADDDRSILTLLSYHFRQNDFEVTTADDGKKAYDKARKNPFDLILLDLMMPEFSGIEVTKKLRKEGNFTPILILTARDDDEMKLTGLSAGSDEYLDKTTPMKEIIVRANALIRRSQMYNDVPKNSVSTDNNKPTSLITDRMEIDFVKKEVTFDGKILDLTKREFEILELLAERQGEVVSREELLKHFWGISESAETRTIDVLISKIRKKLDNRYIKTKRGFGYYFEENEA
ncbi:response regulator transcription factor [Lactococcus protaetiae]|uniref:Transcriptional regulatory protein DltR n=1 Tax=Lactococcus protaetiae TaxID=2592653 RepID=A0A514Z8X9_9LACT|nr:response regulator transcription factor [Lactococcus protaetiae]MCL2112772.1 response regulator transcription factor [Streptococcaceae bacterium]QDK71055.1 response regulator transcription factor [Lactococcus protaetiae]